MWNGLEGRDYFGEKCSAITALKFQRKLIHIRTYRNWGKSMTNIIGTDYLYHYTSLEKLALILKPVSYTHLDVYKRQVLCGTWTIAVSSALPGTMGAACRWFPAWTAIAG